MSDDISAILFIESKALQSGRVVELLRRRYPEVSESAAVYSETDVIGVVSASQERLGDILLEIMQRIIPDFDKEYGLETSFGIDDVRISLVLGNLTHYDKNPLTLNSDVAAYVIVQTDEYQGTQAQILRGLSKCEGVVFAAALISNKDIFVKVKAPNKLSFDNKIMEQVQAVPGVKTTQSFIIINEKYFVRNDLDSNAKQEQSENLSNVAVWAKQRK